MKTLLFWDIDGVLRSLDKAVLGVEADKWDIKINGLSFIDYVSQNKELLYLASTNKYYNVLMNIKNLDYLENKILSCQPPTWRNYTLKWLKKYNLNDLETIFVDNIENKLVELVKAREKYDKVYLIDDYPFNDFDVIFVLRDSLILIDKKYNRKTYSTIRIKKPCELESFIKSLNKK